MYNSLHTPHSQITLTTTERTCTLITASRIYTFLTHNGHTWRHVRQ